ncbi:Hypothetical predicted protein [Olea europaea subsp. europaea]|uniref:Uncharacterized protein n=1 Tax=Olea europaea subsp. europaea TaxID=158383 RepID=A0A8S0VB45_OLEEU|nr:Hypothetical predicted protein [Olea europaea subsp. europaea]
MGDPYTFEFEDNTMNENRFLQTQVPQEGFNIEDDIVVDIDGELNDSDNEIDDDNFEIDNSVPKCVSVEYNHVLGEEDQGDLEREELYYPSSEKLDIDFTYGEERPAFDAPRISRDNEKGVAAPEISHVRVESIFVDELVKDLQEFDVEENSKRREAISTNRRIVRGFVSFVEPPTISK